MLRKAGFTTILTRVCWVALLMGVYACVVYYTELTRFGEWANVSVGLEAALTFAVSMLLIFLTNRAYERWWEARTLWGTQVNVSRNLAIKIRELVHPNEEETRLARKLIVGFCHALRLHLREGCQLSDVPEFETASERPVHVPSYLAGEIYRLLDLWAERGQLSDDRLRVIDREAREFLDVCGACERIKNTPISVSWRAFIRQLLVVYLLTLPWGLVDQFLWLTIPLTIMISYAVIAGEAIAHEIEHPFGNTEDHLDLEAICQTIDLTVSEILAAPTPSRSIDADTNTTS